LSIHGIAHITGGGITENIIRIIPKSCNILIRRDTWDIPPVFTFLKESGHIDDMEMMRTFNNGIGMIVVTPDTSVQDTLERLNGMDEKAWVIGEVVEGKDSENRVVWA
jgi:phosphoribosylformylglycinamidine cyclo-ligase